MEKINLVEILKDCPKGMELDCTTWFNVTFEKVVNDEIYIKRNNKVPSFDQIIVLNKYGCCTNHQDEKCRIFPKGKKSWEGFQRPFKEGDIVCYVDAIAIFKEWRDETLFRTYVATYLFCNSLIDVNIPFYGKSVRKEIRLATEKEKQKLFQAIKDNGYKWDDKNKILEKVIKPKFKVGDIVRSKNCPTAGNFVIIGVEEDNYSIGLKNYCIKFKDQDNYEVINKPKFKVGDRVKPTYNTNQYIIKGITTTHYTLEEVKHKFKYIEPIINDKDWELVPDKFDVTTLKPFDKVLVRDSIFGRWKIEFFEKFDKGLKYPFICINGRYSLCIPYNGNEYLHDTINPCSDYYQI